MSRQAQVKIWLSLLPALLSKADGDRHGRARADEVCQCKIDDDKRHGEVEGGKGGIPKILAYKYAFQKLEQGRGQHADSPRNGCLKKQLCRRRLGKECFVVHKVLLLIKNITKKDRAADDNSAPYPARIFPKHKQIMQGRVY